MDQIEQETSRDDPAAEVTDPPSIAGEGNGTAPPVSARPVSARPTSIWRNWPLVTAAGILLLLIIMILPILPTIRNQLSHQAAPRSSPGVTQTVLMPTRTMLEPTNTPIISPFIGDHIVSPDIVDGVAYIGAAGGAVSAVRISNGSLLWQHKTTGDTSAAPLVVNGVVYAAAEVNNGPGYIYALNASNGSLLWSYKTGSYTFIPSVVNGVAYIASEDDTVTALQASNGRLLWQSNLKARLFDSPIVDSGVVFVTSDKNLLYALRASDGAQLWQYPSDTGFPLALNGVVYAGSGQTLVALKADTGTVLWHASLDGLPWYQPVLGNGIMYLVVAKITEQTSFAPTDGGGYALREAIPSTRKTPAKMSKPTVYALRMSDGTVLWQYKGNNTNEWATQIVLTGGKIFGAMYINTSQSYVYALSASNGSPLWGFASENNPHTLAVGDGVVYVGSDNILFALKAGDGSPLWSYALLGTVYSDLAVDGTTIYASADNGITYALQANTGVLRWYYLTKISN